MLLCSKAPEMDRRVPSGEYRAKMLEAEAKMGLRLEDDGYQLVDGQGKLYQTWMLEPVLEAAAPEKMHAQLRGDGVLTLVWLYGVCQGNLESYAREHPAPARWERAVPCPWSERGRVAAELDGWSDFTREADGSRCRRDKKVTITPRDDLPLIRLVAQNVSQELAQELLGEYEKKLLEQLQG